MTSVPTPSGLPAHRPEPPAPPKKSLLPLILFLNLVAIIAVALVLYFALKK